ncbi:hypothetical protein [Bifidobacterium castoris]|uniref:Uncharacterized protein n=1 Tax=Bifidobacterium castoris TaxID=2306972 RepID=A0A430FAI9_9BIFI|nr:hypothetical protein [Bifidobacterium castoris]RSX49857.1 hypothetical protein D2E22_0318 [Bifidobacterium castoris]
MMTGPVMMLAEETLPRLPVMRWADVATVLENRTDGLIDYITNLFKSVPLSIEGLFLSIGNGLWSGGAWLLNLSSGAASDTAGERMGESLNTLIGSLYKAITGDWMIPAIIIVFALIASVTLVFKGQGAGVLMKRLGALSVGLAMFVTMGAAAATHPGSPSTGTPWWTAEQVRNVVATTGDAVSQSAINAFSSMDGTLRSKNNHNMLSCRGYLWRLNETTADPKAKEDGTPQQAKQFTPDDTAKGRTDTLLKTMNMMWEETGLRMWIRAQYGPGANGSDVFCRVLEYRAGASAAEQANLTNQAVTYSDAGGRNVASEDAMAFNPNLLLGPDEGPRTVIDKALNDKSDNPAPASNIMLDRMVTMWDTCKYVNTDGGRFATRYGWEWVDLVRGPNRGFGEAGQMDQYCSAVISGTASFPGSDMTDFGAYERIELTQKQLAEETAQDAKDDMASEDCSQFDGDEWQKTPESQLERVNDPEIEAKFKRCQALRETAADKQDAADAAAASPTANENTGQVRRSQRMGSGTAEDKVLRLIAQKFDLSNSNTAWLATAQSIAGKYGDNPDNHAAAVTASIKTMQMQHGDASLADAGGSIIFAVAGAVNFVIWGVLFGLLRIIALICAYLTVLGLWVALLMYAAVPDRGRAAMANAFRNMVAMFAVPSVLSIGAALVCIIMTLLMQIFGIIDHNGNTSATVLVMGVATLVFPFLSVKALQWLCVNVLKIGEPSGWGAIGSLLAATSKGLGTVGSVIGGAAKGLASGIAAGAAGGGVAAIAVNAINGAKASSLAAAAQHGYNSTAFGRAATGRGKGGRGGARSSAQHKPTAAEQAAGGDVERAVDGSPLTQVPDMPKLDARQQALANLLAENRRRIPVEDINRAAVAAHPDDPAAQSAAYRQAMEDAAAQSDMDTALMVAERAEHDRIRKTLKDNGLDADEATVRRYMEDGTVQATIHANARQSLAELATHRAAVEERDRLQHQRSLQVQDLARQRELNRTLAGRWELTRERYADGVRGTMKTAASVVSGETARFARNHKVAAGLAAGAGMLVVGPAMPGVMAAATLGSAVNGAFAGGHLNHLNGGYGNIAPGKQRVREPEGARDTTVRADAIGQPRSNPIVERAQAEARKRAEQSVKRAAGGAAPSASPGVPAPTAGMDADMPAHGRHAHGAPAAAPRPTGGTPPPPPPRRAYHE